MTAMEIRTVAELEWIEDRGQRRARIARDGRWVTKCLHAVPILEGGKPLETAIDGYRWKEYLEPMGGLWQPDQPTNCPGCEFAVNEFSASR